MVKKGDKVKYFPVKDRDTFVRTTTRSEPFTAYDGTEVILIEGKAGYVAVSHLAFDIDEVNTN